VPGVSSAAAKPDFIDRCLVAFRDTWPIGGWLLAKVSGGAEAAA
jgi:hypothetical protein